jgi:hypothetical protein
MPQLPRRDRAGQGHGTNSRTSPVGKCIRVLQQNQRKSGHNQRRSSQPLLRPMPAPRSNLYLRVGTINPGRGMQIQQDAFVEVRGRPWLVEAIDDSQPEGPAAAARQSADCGRRRPRQDHRSRLVARELLLRRRIDLIVVAAPAAMTAQWKDQLVRPHLRRHRPRAYRRASPIARVQRQSVDDWIPLHPLRQPAHRRGLCSRLAGHTWRIPLARPKL